MTKKAIVRVRDVMKREFDIVDGMMSVKDALVAMKHVETKSLIVDKRNDDDEYGLLLLSDIAKKVLAQDRAPERVNVYEIMSKPVIPLDPEMDVRYCARLFDSFGLSNAPVVEYGQVIGIVSYRELVFARLCEIIH